MSDEYRTVIIVVRQLRTASIMLTRPNKDGTIDKSADGWLMCPRSCIHGGDDLRLTRIQHGLPQEIALRMFVWKADELHLA
jgi:hypothetical protein